MAEVVSKVRGWLGLSLGLSVGLLGCADDGDATGALGVSGEECAPEGCEPSGTGGMWGTGGAPGGTAGLGTGGAGDGAPGRTPGTDDSGSGGADPGSGGEADGAEPAEPGATVPCPAPYECNADPLLGALFYCAEPGALPLPPGCTTDADCVAAGLPDASCVAEEETGLNGCLQTCE